MLTRIRGSIFRKPEVLMTIHRYLVFCWTKTLMRATRNCMYRCDIKPVFWIFPLNSYLRA
uniref:Uncharacterized protein n=1 Tax=Arundo donax TaxID=35708 RepID=A0A0A9FZH2_ARUDO